MSDETDPTSMNKKHLDREDARREAARRVSPTKPGPRRSADPGTEEPVPERRQQAPPRQAERHASAQSRSRGADPFLNPYNFVRFLDTARPRGHVLGDCLPPPHDRYVGLTGRIVCELEAKTPLFVSDPDDVRVAENNEHYSFRFFHARAKDGTLQPILPATSLRGMLRSVFEAATNSCFAVFDGNQCLEFRERPEFGNRLLAGIVNVLPEPAKDGKPGRSGEIVLCQVAKVGAYYEGTDAWKNVLTTRPDGEPWKCGDAALARVKRLARGSVARALALSRRDLGPLDRDEQYAEGWLKITGKGEGTSKRNEFLFLNPDKHRPPAPGVVTFDIGAMDEYNLVLAGQIDRGDLPASPQSPKLAVGDLVWASAGDGKNSKFADRIVRVKVPRTPYHYTIGDILPDHLYHCERYDALCPACRVFGWVHGDAAKLQQTDRVAYAGRVRLSPGEMIHSEGTIDDPEVGIPLAILSTPKPTTTQFYLLKNGQPDSHITYDDKQKGALLRGRKVYRHHGSQPSEHAEGPEYERKGGIQDGQNRTVRGVLKKGAIFEFTLEFENLAALELGALLWSLTLEEGMHHRLGYAKPLGFGSVAIRIKEGGLRLISPERYSSLGAGGWIAVAEQQRRNWIGDFKTALTGLYGGADSFLDLPHIRDLLALTVTPDVEAIHYPRLEHVPQTEGENFKWFVANKKRRFPHVLGLPEDESPLPLNPGH